jgi:hypothetical protein
MMGSFIICIISPTITMVKSWRVSWTELATHAKEIRNAHNTLVGKSEVNRSCVRSRYRWGIIMK